MSGVAPAKIGLIGSIFFVGGLCGGFIFPRWGDLKGRKPPLLFGAFLSIACFVGLILSKDLALTTGLYFFLGLCNEAKIGVNWVYLLEFTPTRYQAYIGTSLNIVDGMTLFYLAVYFRYISKYWLYYEIFGLCNGVIGTLAILILPESPYYLYGKKRYYEAKKNLEFIARFNRVKNYETNFRFDTELSNEEPQSFNMSSVMLSSKVDSKLEK